MRLKGGTVPFEDERYAYLVLEAPSSAGDANESGGRILRPPRASKHEIVFSLCRADGTMGDASIDAPEEVADILDSASGVLGVDALALVCEAREAADLCARQEVG